MKKRFLIFLLSVIGMIFVFTSISFAASIPSAPTIKSFTANSTSSITIKWGAVSGATKYKITRSYADENDYKTITSSCTSTSYTDTGLKTCGRYYYRVYAINSAGTSARSETYRTRTKCATPVISSISRDSSSQLTINWGSVSGATKYRIDYRRGDEDSYTTLSSSLTTTSYTHKGLKPNSKYWYRIYAVKDDIVGSVSNKVSKSILSDHSETIGKWTAFPKPSVTIYEDYTDRLTLSWDKSYGGSNYSYEVWRKSPTDSALSKIKTVSTTSYTDTDLTSGTVYQYQIRVVVTETNSACINTDKFYASPKIAKNIVLIPQSAATMKVSWDKLSSDTGLNYKVKRYNSNSSSFEELGWTKETYYLDNNLTVNNTYKYYVQVWDQSNNYLTSTYAQSAVLKIMPTGVFLNKNSANVEISDTLALAATISPSNSTSNSLTWSSSDTSIATVSSNGVVTPVAEGSTIITVKTTNGKTAECEVTVTSCSHSYGDWIVNKEPDCIEKGIEYRKCSKCGYIDTEFILPKGHSYFDDWKIIKEASCSEDGEMAHICSVCGAESDNTIISKTGHLYGEWIITEEATCQHEGSRYRACSVCGHTETEIITATDHNYELISDVPPSLNVANSGVRTYVCSVCGQEYNENYSIEKEVGTISIESQNANQGDTITLPISIADNPGIQTFSLTLEFDETVLTLKALNKGELITSGSFIANISSKTAHWNETSYKITNDGILFYAVFEVSDTAVLDDYTVSLVYEDDGITTEEDGVKICVKPNQIDGVVSLINADEVLRGDVNLDKNLNANDSILLARYLAHWNITFNEKQTIAADVYADSFINAKDAVRLAQLLMGYTPTKSAYSVATNSLKSTKITTIKAESCKGVIGQYVDVPISISNNSGIAGLNLIITYDKDVFDPISVINGTLLYGDITSNLDEANSVSSDLDHISISWSDADNMTENGILFTIRFLVKDSAEISEEPYVISLSYDEGNICSQDLDDVDMLLSDGSITISDKLFDCTINEVNADFAETNSVNFNIGCENSDLTSAVAILAVYDEEERLISSTAEEMTLSKGYNNVVIKTANEDAVPTGYSYKIMLWSSMESMQPLADEFYGKV